MTRPASDLAYEPPCATVSLRGLGTVEVVGRRLRMQTSGSHRPASMSCRSWASLALAECVRPRMSVSAIDGLGDAARRRLMLAVLRTRDGDGHWRALHGSFLSFDERFQLAVALSRHDAARRLTKRLRERRAEHGRADVAAPSVAKAFGMLDGFANMQRCLAGSANALKTMTAPLEAIKALTMVSDAVRPPALSHGFVDSIGPGSAIHSNLAAVTAVAGVRDALARSVIGAGPRSGLAEVSVRSSMPPGFAAVLRPYAADPYRVSGAGLAGPARVLEGVRAAMPATRIKPGVLTGLAGLLNDRLAPLSGGVMDGAFAGNLAKQLDVIVSRPLFDGRTMELLRGGVLRNFGALPDFDARRFQDVLAPLRGFGEAMAEAAAFMEAWEEDPLWFLLSVFGMGSARRFAGLTSDEVEQALLHALADTLTDGDYLPALRQALKTAPHLGDVQRAWLDHGLAHAHAGDWTKAVPPLLAGLEGALHRAAVQTTLIRDRGGKFMAAEKLVKEMALSDDYTLFVVRRVFGGIGNAFRHGRADSGERDQTIFAIVALAGWLDYFTEADAVLVLVGEMQPRLDRAIAEVTSVTPALTA